jgi:uncharacterized Zn-binding protein involved in type VI secretion
MTSPAYVMHPTTTVMTASDGPTAVGVLFNGIPPVLAGDKTMVHTVVIGKAVLPCIGFAVPSQGNVLVNGRPVIKVFDFYQCTCGGQCDIVGTASPNIIIGE